MAANMRCCLLFSFLGLWTCVVSANDEGSKTSSPKKWFIGVEGSLNSLQGWEARHHILRRTWFEMNYSPLTPGNKIYGGYRLLDNVDVEIAYWRAGDWTYSYMTTENSLPIQNVVYQRISVRGQYISGAFRPFSSKWGKGLFLKLGVHHSTLTSITTVDGNPQNIGGNNPDNGSISGNGVLWGLGYDVVTGQAGAVRVEFNKYQNVGGSSFGNQSWGVGYHVKF